MGFSRYSNCCALVSPISTNSTRLVVQLSCPYQSVLLPCDALLLVGVGVCETIDGTSLAAEEPVEVGPDLVALTLLQVVALCAPGLREVRVVPALYVRVSEVIATAVARDDSTESSSLHTLNRLAPFLLSPNCGYQHTLS